MLSIIVPVYNCEKYISRCLDSLIKQDIDKEIIVVNDGSSDNSENVILDYTSKYDFIKYISISNHGVSYARNIGIKNSCGDYLAFVDSDDYVDDDYFKILYNKIFNSNYDVVCGDIKLVFDNYSKDYVFNYKDYISNKDYLANIYPVVVNKVYKRELFDNVIFKENIYFEDVDFLFKIFLYIKNIGFVHNSFYNYIQRSNTLSTTYDKRMIYYIDLFNNLVSYYKDNGFYEEFKNVLEYNYVRYLYATMIKRCKGFNYKDYIDVVDKAILSVKKYFPKYRKNKLFYKSLKGIYLVLFNKLLAKIYYRI